MERGGRGRGGRSEPMEGEGAWPRRGSRVLWGCVLGGVIDKNALGGVPWAGGEANEALGACLDRGWSQWAAGGVSRAEPRRWARGPGRYRDGAAGGAPGPGGRGAPALGAARAAAALRRLGRPLRAGCGGSGVPGTASRRRLALLRFPRAARRGAAAGRGLRHRARSAGAPPARVPLPARRGRQRGDAGAGAEHRALPGAAALRPGHGAAARARRALRRRDGGGGPGRGAGAEHGAAGAAAGHQAGRFPVPDDEEQPLEPAVQGGAGGGDGAAGAERSLAEAAGPGGGILGEGHHRGGEHPGHRLHLRGGLHLPEVPCAAPGGRLRASMALEGGTSALTTTSHRPTWLLSKACPVQDVFSPPHPPQHSWSKSGSSFISHPQSLYLGTVRGGSPSLCAVASHPHPSQG